LILVVPSRDVAFDHRRPLTTLNHLIEDARVGVDESDLTHLPEILQLHDLKLDPGIGSRAEFEARSRNNRQNRCLHHHVFDMVLLKDLVEYVGFDLVKACRPSAGDLVVVGTRRALTDSRHL
jgi:hypothetical protein